MLFHEKRREHRAVYEAGESAFVELKAVKGSARDERYDLRVSDCSKNGFAMLITEKHFDLLNVL
ncbi:MAG: hypothetical protein ABII06_22410, partial [Pseudomonadota bacterium]